MNASDIVYGELRFADVNSQILMNLNRLLSQVSTKPKQLTLEHVQKVLNVGTRVFVASVDGYIVGMVQLVSKITLGDQKDWIEEVVVDEDYRRQGIFGQLMDRAEAASAVGNASSLNLTTRKDRGVVEIYEQRGWKHRNSGLLRLDLRSEVKAG